MTTLPPRAVSRAMRLAAAVHDYEQLDVHDLLSELTRGDLYGVAVALAAMVDVDQTPRQLLAWNDPDSSDKPGRFMAPCGTHAAFNRHKSRGETPCPDCREGERVFQRHRRRRERQAS